MKRFKNYIPLIIIISLMALFWGFGFNEYLSYEMFDKHRIELTTYVNSHQILAPFVAALIYAIFIALSIPAGFLLTLIVGFLFVQPLSLLIVVVGATLGAVVIFLIAKTALKDFFEKKAKKSLTKMQDGFKKNSTSYMLILRVVPLFPFWLVNVAPAFFKVRLWTYTWTTFIGIIPASFVYTQAGRGIEKLFSSEKPYSIFFFFSTEMIIGISGILILAIIPIIVKNIMRKRKIND